MNPPLLVIRPRKALWVETRSPQDATATPGAFADGCYSGTWWYDSSGGVWTVVEATLQKRPSLLDRVLQRPVAVELTFGSRAERNVAEARARLREILSDDEFCDSLRTSAGNVWAQFESARTTADLVAIAGRLE